MNSHNHTPQHNSKVPGHKPLDQALQSIDKEFDQFRLILSPFWAWNLLTADRSNQPVPVAVRSQEGVSHAK